MAPRSSPDQTDAIYTEYEVTGALDRRPRLLMLLFPSVGGQTALTGAVATSTRPESVMSAGERPTTAAVGACAHSRTNLAHHRGFDAGEWTLGGGVRGRRDDLLARPFDATRRNPDGSVDTDRAVRLHDL